MKKILMTGVSVFAVTALSSPADAGNAYIALGAGAVIVQDRDFERDPPPKGPFTQGEIELGGGAIFEGAVGFDTQIGAAGVRFEFQATNFDVDAENVLYEGTSFSGGAPPGDRVGIVDHWLLMVNVLVDLGDFGGLVPYVGVGGGIDLANWDFGQTEEHPKHVSFNSESETGMVWQAIVGASFPVATNLDVYGNYRFIGLPGGNLDEADSPGGPTEIDMDFAHAFTIGIRYSFL